MPYSADARGCKDTYRVKEEQPFENTFDGLDTTTSLGDLDLIGQLFPLPPNDFTQDAAYFSSQPTFNAPAAAGPGPATVTSAPAAASYAPTAGPSGLPHASSSGSSELHHVESHDANLQGHDSDKPDTKTAQVSRPCLNLAFRSLHSLPTVATDPYTHMAHAFPQTAFVAACKGNKQSCRYCLSMAHCHLMVYHEQLSQQ